MPDTSLTIIADENIVGLQAFEKFADVIRVRGRDIDAGIVQKADALLVRSVTRVDRSLLQHSPLTFVASATSGTDHVDIDYLQQQGIHFACAPGSNANSVVQYVIAALAFFSRQRNFDWRKKTVGIIGAGNIGTLLADTLSALEISFVMHDPFLGEAYPYARFLRPLQEVLRQDLVSIHTPLTRDGPHPTYHMFDRDVLRMLSPETVLINTARGSVIDNRMLEEILSQAEAPACVLDVWENEPGIALSLLDKVTIATPHIAGYSVEGKERGTMQIYRQLVNYFQIEAPDYPQEQERQELVVEGGDELQQINQAILGAYNIEQDHGAMLKLKEASSPAAEFDALRKHYPPRHEPGYYRLDYSALKPSAAKILRQLGFR